MKYKKVIILCLLLLYKLIYKTSFFINIIIALYIFYIIFKILKNKSLKKICKVLFIIGGLIFIFSLGIILNDINVNISREVKNDYVIILGAGLNKDKPKKILIKRLDKAIEYFNKYPTTIFIVSGGQGKDETISESCAMKKYLKEYGLPDNQIIEENKSTSTLENIKFSKIKISRGSTVGVISNDFHVYRAKCFGNKIGLKLNGIYAKTPFWGKVSAYSRESIAIIYYWIYRKLNIFLRVYSNEHS